MSLVQYEAPTTDSDVIVQGVLRFLSRTRDWKEDERFFHVGDCPLRNGITLE
jgi:hypothetical protein